MYEYRINIAYYVVHGILLSPQHIF